ncbi:hypothetical protein FJZ31_20525 [Candidatus Poribacteria bacterium]|nr:hypothetical protein [Candidatus Poribacteria bacterium]
MELLPVREFADRGTKWLLESPENVLGLLQILDFNLSTKIDFSRLHDEKKTFILDNLRQQESDLVVTAPFWDEERELNLAIENLEKLPDSESRQWIRAMHYILLLIYNRCEPEEHAKLTDIVTNAVQDRKRREEVSKMGRTIAQALIEEGMEIGVEKGIVQTKQEVLIDLIQFRFQSIRPEINDKIRSIRNVDNLTALFRRALGANSIEELGIE